MSKILMGGRGSNKTPKISFKSNSSIDWSELKGVESITGFDPIGNMTAKEFERLHICEYKPSEILDLNPIIDKAKKDAGMCVYGQIEPWEGLVDWKAIRISYELGRYNGVVYKIGRFGLEATEEINKRKKAWESFKGKIEANDIKFGY